MRISSEFLILRTPLTESMPIASQFWMLHASVTESKKIVGEAVLYFADFRHLEPMPVSRRIVLRFFAWTILVHLPVSL